MMTEEQQTILVGKMADSHLHQQPPQRIAQNEQEYQILRCLDRQQPAHDDWKKSSARLGCVPEWLLLCSKAFSHLYGASSWQPLDRQTQRRLWHLAPMRRVLRASGQEQRQQHWPWH